MLRLSNLLWVLLLAGAFLALGTDRAEARTGLASWYGPGFVGLPTASGESCYARCGIHRIRRPRGRRFSTHCSRRPIFETSTRDGSTLQ